MLGDQLKNLLGDAVLTGTGDRAKSCGCSCSVSGGSMGPCIWCGALPECIALTFDDIQINGDCRYVSGGIPQVWARRNATGNPNKSLYLRRLPTGLFCCYEEAGYYGNGCTYLGVIDSGVSAEVRLLGGAGMAGPCNAYFSSPVIPPLQYEWTGEFKLVVLAEFTDHGLLVDAALVLPGGCGGIDLRDRRIPREFARFGIFHATVPTHCLESASSSSSSSSADGQNIYRVPTAHDMRIMYAGRVSLGIREDSGSSSKSCADLPCGKPCNDCENTSQSSASGSGSRSGSASAGGPSDNCCAAGTCCFSKDSSLVLQVVTTSSGDFGPYPCCKPDRENTYTLLFQSCAGGTILWAGDGASVSYDGSLWSASFPGKPKCNRTQQPFCTTCFPTPDPSITIVKDDCCGLDETRHFDCGGGQTWDEHVSIGVVNNNCCRDGITDFCQDGNGICDGTCE